MRKFGEAPGETRLRQRARLLAALSVGTEIIHLRHIAPHLGAAAQLNAALEAFAQANTASAIAPLRSIIKLARQPSERGQST